MKCLVFYLMIAIMTTTISNHAYASKNILIDYYSSGALKSFIDKTGKTSLEFNDLAHGLIIEVIHGSENPEQENANEDITNIPLIDFTPNEEGYWVQVKGHGYMRFNTIMPSVEGLKKIIRKFANKVKKFKEEEYADPDFILIIYVHDLTEEEIEELIKYAEKYGIKIKIVRLDIDRLIEILEEMLNDPNISEEIKEKIRKLLDELKKKKKDAHKISDDSFISQDTHQQIAQSFKNNIAERNVNRFFIDENKKLVASPWINDWITFHSPQSIFSSPNVGGVYLDKAAEVIGDLSDIEGAVFDPVSQRIILICRDNEEVSSPAFRLDDIAAAFRSIYSNFISDPGVTIDPDPENPKAPMMLVRFFGGVENTHFGEVLFEADRLMKSLSLGQDNITKEKITADVDGFYNMLDLSFSDLGGAYNKNLWSRFWLVPDQVLLKISDNRQSISFPDTRIKVKTETMKWQDGKLIPAGEKDEKSEYFAAFFSRFYDNFADEFSVYHELKNLTNIVALAKWMKASGIAIDLSWIDRYAEPYHTPEKTPSLTVSESRSSMIATKTVQIFGGTDLSFENRYIKDNEKSDFREKALNAVALSHGIATSTITDQDNNKKKIIAIPSSQTRIAGAKILVEDELLLLNRIYCSFHNEKGAFGHSWYLDLPKLHISHPNKGAIEKISIKKKEIKLQHFRLTRCFGMQDIVFKKHIVDQMTGALAFVPDRKEGIKCLYPNPQKEQYKIAYDDGRMDIFNSEGNMVESVLSSGNIIKYSFNNGRLVEIAILENQKPITYMRLAYNADGYINSVKTGKHTIKYIYNDEGNLIKVDTGDKIKEYAYNTLHLVSHIKINGESAASFKYDKHGRVILQKNHLSGNQLNTKITALNGRTIFKDLFGSQKIKRTYDNGGRLLSITNNLGSEIYLEYGEDSSRKVKLNNGSNKMTIEYLLNDRFIKYTDSDGKIWAFLFDEFGRLKQIQDDKNALMNKEYGMTKDGIILENTETSGLSEQAVFDKDKKLVKKLVTSKLKDGGQLILENTYDKNGNIKFRKIKGLVNETYLYDNNQLTHIQSGDEAVSLSYDKQKRLSSVFSKERSLDFFYDNNHLLKNCIFRQKDNKEELVFNNGQIVKRFNSRGLNDCFEYDSKQRLQKVIRDNGEIWEIIYKKDKIVLNRNRSKYATLVYDDQRVLKEIIY